MNTVRENASPDSPMISSIERKAPPSTESLQQRILAETRHLPQIQPTLESSNKRTPWRRFSWYFLPISGLAVMVLSVVIGFNTILPQQPEDIVLSSSQQTTFTMSDELAWQDVMLMHDELAFIDL